MNQVVAQDSEHVAQPNEYHLLASSIGTSHSTDVIGGSDYYVLSGAAGETLVSGFGTNGYYQLASGFWAQVQALRKQDVSRYRTIDGADNNHVYPEYGQADTQLWRLASVTYADGLSEPRGGFNSMLPSPRTISNIVVAQSEPIFNMRGVSDLFWQWGQFVDHDIDLTEAIEPHESFPITVPADDPLFNPPGFISLNRSIYDTNTGTTSPREQINQITAFIDASQVYGSSIGRAKWKREVLPDDTARANLRTSANNLLPYEPEGNCPSNSNNPCFGAGDIRAAEQPGLSALHTLFMREHNRLVTMLRAEHPYWTEDELYETVRLLLGAELQQITYEEWLPLLLGLDALDTYTIYDNRVNPNIANEFSTACFRFGHTMLSSTLLRLDADGSSIGDVPLRDGFFNTSYILNDGIDPILRGLMTQQAQALDTQLVDDVRNFLFGPPGAGGFDLAALNIQRGRDHGLASYNDVRAALGLGRINSFADITSDPTLQNKLLQAYNSVDEIDLWIGGLAENAVNGGLLGETCSAVLVDQFKRLRDGDRFWHENISWSHYELAADPILGSDGTVLSAVTLADIIGWNSGVTNVPVNPFFAPETIPETVDNVLGIYVIAADNSAENPTSLSPFVRPTILNIRAATLDAPDKTAVILVDYPGDVNTTILVIENGNIENVSRIDGLPNSNGEQHSHINEYDLTDGKTVGGFLLWARNTYSDERTRTYVSYIGHGTAVAPANDYPLPTPPLTTRIRTTNHTSPTIPLPYIVGVSPAYTDVTPQPSLITPYDLQAALDIATDNGENPFDIVDLSHCFAATIEELTELANPDGDAHAEVFIGSPNYTYLAPALPGAVLTAIKPQETVVVNASQLLNTYDTTLATYETDTVIHPGIWVAVAGSAIEPIESAVDTLSMALLSQFETDPDGTQNALQIAYQTAGAFYDTPIAKDENNQCTPDWALTNEDSLIDLKAFMQQIQLKFAAYTEVADAAQAVEEAVDNAILHKVARDGIPWFANNNPEWTFSESNRSGIAMLGALTGEQNNDMVVLPYQTTYYTDTISVHKPDDNLHPLAFVQSESASWADVMTRYWQTRNVPLGTIACLPELPFVQQTGEVTVTSIILPLEDTVRQFEPVSLGARISADTDLFFFNVLFEVFHEGQVLYTDVKTVSHLRRGSAFVQSSTPWLPTLDPGKNFTVSVTIDPDNRIVESIEDNNTLTRVDQIVMQDGFVITATVQNEHLWFSTRTVPLVIEDDLNDGRSLTELEIQLYSYVPDATNPDLRVTNELGLIIITDLSDLSNVVLELPDDTPAGFLLARIWGRRNVYRSANYSELQFNYAPPDHLLNAGDSVEFLYTAKDDDSLRLALTQTSGVVTWYTQTPFMFWSAEMITGTGTILIGPSPAGEYILQVKGGSTGGAYTFDVQRNDVAGRATAATTPAMVEMMRPEFIEPVVQAPNRPTTAITLTTINTVSYHLPFTLVAILIVVSLVVVRRKRQLTHQ
ncbi:MAG: peroxidase family protein [Candidatus Promineifilaceae bacterium]